MMEQNSPWLEHLAARIERWPRVLRIGLTLMITVVVVVVVWGVLAELIGGGAANPKPNPAMTLIVIILGMFIYGACWAALVGFENQPDKTWQAGPSAVYALIAGAVSLVVIVVALVVLLA